MYLPILTAFASATLALAASETPASSSIASPAISSASAYNSTFSHDEDNIGTCVPKDKDPARYGQWAGWPDKLAYEEQACNSMFNKITRPCCDEAGGETKMGKCGLLSCKVNYNVTGQEEALLECFKRSSVFAVCAGEWGKGNSSSTSPVAGLVAPLLAVSLVLASTL